MKCFKQLKKDRYSSSDPVLDNNDASSKNIESSFFKKMDRYIFGESEITKIKQEPKAVLYLGNFLDQYGHINMKNYMY